MSHLSLKRFGLAPLFDPAEGVTVIDPPGSGLGWWAGAPGALRYLDTVQFPDRIFYYYEYARPDGSHETRLNVVEI